ncbi:MAG: hypothetical protein M1835_002458 [Candelina submexicana]|nr:MAG: hypothetical protein M1835_002458 [Candelina submexicana]
MPSKPYNVGIIGYGLSAKIFHLPFVLALPSDFIFHAIVQRNPQPDNDAQKDHPGIKSYRSTEELVKDENVDIVIVTTGPETHYELTVLALKAGKHVVVEKPFTPTSKEADELVTLAKKQDRLLTVYHSARNPSFKHQTTHQGKLTQPTDRRWDSDFLTLSHLITNNSLGRIVEFEIHFDRHRPEIPAPTWKTTTGPTGGAVYDLGTHLIDQVVYTFGLPQRITGFVGAQRRGDTGGYEDSCTVLMHYGGGLLATVKAGVVSPETAQLRFWVRGEKGSFKKFHLDCQEEQLKAGLRPGDKDYGIESEDHHGILSTSQNGHITQEVYPTVNPPTYVEYYRQLAKALSGEGDVPVKGEDASAVIRLIELARESSKLGRTLDV